MGQGTTVLTSLFPPNPLPTTSSITLSQRSDPPPKDPIPSLLLI